MRVGDEYIRSLRDYEHLFKSKVADKIITDMLRRFGTDVTVKRHITIGPGTEDRNVQDPELLSEAIRKAYGEYSGLSPNPKPNLFEDLDATENIEFEARILIAKILAEVADAAASGIFERLSVWSKVFLTTNDIIIVDSDDGSQEFFIIGQPLQAGVGTAVINRWELDSLAEQS